MDYSEASNSNSKSQENTKIGSLQKFETADDIAENYCSDLYEVSEVHKIAVLDMRILNLDRNEGNILLKKE